MWMPKDYKCKFYLSSHNILLLFYCTLFRLFNNQFFQIFHFTAVQHERGPRKVFIFICFISIGFQKINFFYSFVIDLFSQNYIVHCWRMVRIKIICKFKAWCPAHTHKMQRWVEATRLAFIQSYRTFIIRNRCHLHRFCTQHIIHTPKHIMDTIYCPFHRPMNFTKIFTRWAVDFIDFEVIMVLN